MGRASTEGFVAQAAATRLEEPDFSSSKWYFSREEIEKSSPSRKDGIDGKKEAQYRRSYCAYLQELGMKLKMPQIAIATAIVFCHRFFLRQSHARNDRFMVATIGMFLAGKVEETPRPANDVVLVSYALRHKKPITKEVYQRQLRLLLTGENLLLSTLGFDLNVSHPYRPMVLAVRKLAPAFQSSIAQVAWNFINDGLKTTLFLQFKPHHIAAGAIFLGAKFLKLKLPGDGEKAWWREFRVTPRQLEEVSNQMLELYEQAGSNPSRASRPSARVDSPPSGQVSTQTEVRDDVSRRASNSPGEVISRKEPDVVEPQQEKTQVESIDEAKLKAALKRRKSRVEAVAAPQKQDVVTDEELLERELENGIEVARPKKMENGDMHRETGKQAASLKRERPDEVAAKRDRPDEEVVRREVAVKKECLDEVVIAKPDEVKERIDEVVTQSVRPAEVTVEKERVDEVVSQTDHHNDVLAQVAAMEDRSEERSDEMVAKRERLHEVVVKIERSDEEVVAERDHPDKEVVPTKIDENVPALVKKELPDGVIEKVVAKSDEVVVKEDNSDEVMEKKISIKEERPEADVTAAKSDEKRERPEEEEPASKRKRLNDEDLPSKPPAAAAAAAVKVEAPDEEEGELPSSGHDFPPPRSPPRPLSRERRMVSPHERPRPPAFLPFDTRYDRRRDFHQYARRETFFDRQPQPQHHNAGFRHHRDYYAPHHQFQQQQQHYYQQQPRQMEWQHQQQQHHHHHHRPPPPPPPREPWMERDAKKARYDSYVSK
ncbi:cyclin-T1-4 [Selaginella moellendorffii]|nr:cyclin-T1-4 [Selaginella moellendorffii]|eukprot:XP_002992165.2 cyclin-T1-4 [Selaginella moellendorffii]